MFGMKRSEHLHLLCYLYFQKLIFFFLHKKFEPASSTANSGLTDPQTVERKTEESIIELRNMSEEDLIKLKKINFKKKVSGKVTN